MRKKLLVRYGLLCLPFFCGLGLYITGSYTLISSLLFFVGGYVAIKNICDYRKVKRNIRLINNGKKRTLYLLNDNISKVNDNEFNEKNMLIKDDDGNNIKYINYDNISGLKKYRKHMKVRRRY